MKKIIGLIVLLFTMCGEIKSQAVADFNVVPLPQNISIGKSKKGFLLSEEFVITTNQSNGDMIRNAKFLVQYIFDITSKKVELSLNPTRKVKRIELLLNQDAVMDDEAYRIVVAEKAIKIEGKTPQGIFYCIQTLRKALPYDEGCNILIPNAVVEGSPRFAYRGLHLDCARHFFDLKTVKQYIDMMALHGINTFHWHITDDQGWRIEIKKYPLLTSIGGFRDGTVIGRNSGLYNNICYGGFYTQDEAREIVKYASERFIEVIPEIDMPGHMLSAMAAYPWLGCSGGPYHVERSWGVFDESTFQFVEDVLSEIIDIFPSKRIHIGGDEAPRVRWQNCELCQKRIVEEHLFADKKHSAEDQLQSYFTKRVEKYLHSCGRTIIGWDEILDGNVDTTATVMSWRGIEGGQNAAEQGFDVIIAPNSPLYFDHYQTPATDWINPTLIGGFSPISKVYALEPAPATMSKRAQQHIIGVQANLWSEYIAYPELLFYQALPRVAALAELQWLQPKEKNYNDFLLRCKKLFPIYECYDWKYCKSLQ